MHALSHGKGKWKGFLFLFVLSLVVLLFDLRFLSRHYDWDSIVYTHNINSDLFWKIFYNPHHIGFESTGYLYLKFWKWLNGPHSIMFGMRLRILFAAILFFFALTSFYWRMYGDMVGAVLLGFAVHFTQGFWFYAQHHDTPLVHSCLTGALFLYCVWNARKGWGPTKLFFGFALQIWNVFFHQSDTIFLTMVPASILLSNSWKGSEFQTSLKLKLIFSYTFLIVFFLTLSYLFVGFILLERNLIAPPESERNFANWLFLYATKEKWGLAAGNKNYVMNFYRGIGDAFLNFEGVKSGLRIKPQDFMNRNALPYNLNLAFWVSILALAFLNISRLWKKFRAELVLLALWLVPSLIFYTWWEGYFFEFWVSSVIGLLIFAALVIQSYKMQSIPHGTRALGHVALFAYVFLLFAVNFTFSTFPRSEKPTISFIEGIEDKYRSLVPEPVYDQK
ncbi:hypothetical protein CH373_06760 [Leptospira perolatii]|uniref:Glycosyltransferase RgtA/B/C/D-like domain-containing protein n=1 Tax=Leptospira perolatii TaxID=2023191 RepID=A0A2M9ZPN2_9LEPT|nr:hypothetical protein CH360_03620 [Leptospira perolatii]PJZ74038.1 hypothetical protein CH373_06760 [Leptospira perolatii]